MAVVRTIKQENPFVQLDKHFFSDVKLSFKAKGLLGYILQLPDTWEIHMKHLEKVSTDGENSVRTAMAELINAGYVYRHRERNTKGIMGDMIYTVYERPEFNPHFKKEEEKQEEEPKRENPVLADISDDSPKRGFPVLDYPVLENPGYINNNLIYNNLIYKKDNDLDNDIDIGGDPNFISEIDSYKLPKRLKKWLKERIERDGGVCRDDLIIDDIEEFYATSPYIKTDADKLNYNFINDIEFTQIVKRIYMMQENIDNLQPLLKTWVLNKLGFKREEAVSYYSIGS